MAQSKPPQFGDDNRALTRDVAGLLVIVRSWFNQGTISEEQMNMLKDEVLEVNPELVLGFRNYMEENDRSPLLQAMISVVYGDKVNELTNYDRLDEDQSDHGNPRPLTRGLSFEEIPTDWATLFEEAGITEDDLRDAETAKKVYDIISDHHSAQLRRLGTMDSLSGIPEEENDEEEDEDDKEGDSFMYPDEVEEQQRAAAAGAWNLSQLASLCNFATMDGRLAVGTRRDIVADEPLLVTLQGRSPLVCNTRFPRSHAPGHRSEKRVLNHVLTEIAKGYFEVKILSTPWTDAQVDEARDPFHNIVVGAAMCNFPDSHTPLGHTLNSAGISVANLSAAGKHGKLFTEVDDIEERALVPGDTIGCGVFENTIYFTVNGKLLVCEKFVYKEEAEEDAAGCSPVVRALPPRPPIKRRIPSREDQLLQREDEDAGADGAALNPLPLRTPRNYFDKPYSLFPTITFDIADSETAFEICTEGPFEFDFFDVRRFVCPTEKELHEDMIDLVWKGRELKPSQQRFRQQLSRDSRRKWSEYYYGGTLEQKRREHLAFFEAEVNEWANAEWEKCSDAHMIKVNLPRTQQDERNGNGEGVWCSVSKETKALYSEDVEDGNVFVGVLNNQPVYTPWMHLYVDDPIIFEMRGGKRGVAFFHQKSALAALAAALYPQEDMPSRPGAVDEEAADDSELGQAAEDRNLPDHLDEAASPLPR